MWKRSDSQPTESTSSNATPQTQPQYSTQSAAAPLKDRAIIGASIAVRGDIKGEEDLLIQGAVEGKIDLGDFNITVGPNGRVKADLYAKIISVEGEVQGNLYGEEKITIRQSGKVKGNLVAPRVSLEDGSTFKGSIDMDYSGRKAKPATQSNTVASSTSKSTKKPEESATASAKSALDFASSQTVAAKGK